jgi:hypothetical protein
MKTMMKVKIVLMVMMMAMVTEDSDDANWEEFQMNSSRKY